MAGPTVVFHHRWAGWSFAVEEEILGARGVTFVAHEDDDRCREAMLDADVILVGGARADADLIPQLRRCVGLIAYSVGMNQIDADAAAKAGIPVRNCPTWATNEVSDHGLTLLLASERRIGRFSAKTLEGNWESDPEVERLRRIRGRQLGIVGAGRIGKALARKARLLGYRTHAYDPLIATTGDPELPLVPLEHLMSTSDAVVVCASLTEESRHVISRRSLAHAKPGMTFVNVARGGLVEEPALAEAIRDGRIAATALDVRDPEPPDPSVDPIAGLPNVILTPHIASAAVEAFEDLHREAAAVAIELLEAAGRLPPA